MQYGLDLLGRKELLTLLLPGLMKKKNNPGEQPKMKPLCGFVALCETFRLRYPHWK